MMRVHTWHGGRTAARALVYWFPTRPVVARLDPLAEHGSPGRGGAFGYQWAAQARYE